MKSLFSVILIALASLLSGSVFGQQRPPRSQDYPVRKNDFYRGKPAAVILDSKRARQYRTRLRQSAKKVPDFAGHYRVVTWGAGLGGFSMAVIDSRTGKVYFPPFLEVGDSDYELPDMPNVINPAWRLNSRLLAVRGRLDWNGVESVYLYSFTNNRFRLVYHIDLVTWKRMQTKLH